MVKIKELAKVPFIENFPLDGRVMYNTIAYSEDSHKFTLYYPDENGKMVSMDTEPVEAAFWSKSPENTSIDIGIPFFQLMANNFSFPEVIQNLIALQNDILNLSVSIEKLSIFSDFFKENEELQHPGSRIFLTDLEYVLGLIRSSYDILFAIFRFLYKQMYKIELPDSLGMLADKSNSNLESKYKFKKIELSLFNSILPFFRSCRKVRDLIYHHGREIDYIFWTPRGPGVSIDKEPMNEFEKGVWDQDESKKDLLPNNIGSLYYLVNKIAEQFLDTINCFHNYCNSKFPKPVGISEKYKLYIRGYYMKNLIDLRTNLQKYWIF